MLLQNLINTFIFNGHEVRITVSNHGTLWFLAKDVFDALEIDWKGAGISLKDYPENQVYTLQIMEQMGIVEVVFIDKAGLYGVLFGSSKPEARLFANWVYEEVLPKIHKPGFFGKLSAKDARDIVLSIYDLTSQLFDSKDGFESNGLLIKIYSLYGILGSNKQQFPEFSQSFDWIENIKVPYGY